MTVEQVFELICGIMAFILAFISTKAYYKAIKIERQMEDDEKILDEVLREKDKEIELLRQKVNELEKRVDDTAKCFSEIRP